MSHIAFHSPSNEDVHIRGWERAWMGGLVGDIAASFIPTYQNDLLASRINPAHYLARQRGDLSPVQVATALHGGGWDDPVFIDYDGTPLTSLSLRSNTALAVGSDPVCLFARLNSQCEIHCYVEGPNRAWMARIIEAGQESGLYRDGAGWDELRELLTSSDDEPVVTSYSVCGGFPEPRLGDDVPPVWKPTRVDEYGEAAWDDWYDIPTEERWRLCMDALRGNPERLVELSPKNLRGKFGHGKSMIDLFVTGPATVTT